MSSSLAIPTISLYMSMKKQHFFLIIFLFSWFYSFSADQQYVDYARKWRNTFIVDRGNLLRIPREDLQTIRKLIKLSADRAEITLKAQGVVFDLLTVVWHTWQNITQTRLNPSHERPHRIKASQFPSFAEFWRIVTAQEEVCKAYALAVQQVTEEDILSEQSAKDAVHAMRAQARVFMIDALTDIKKQLGALYDIAFHKSLDIEEEDEDDDAFFRSIAIADYILSYVPNLALQGFVNADEAHNVITEEGWNILEKIQLIGNQVWHAIETSRLAFYKALLHEVDVLNSRMPVQ